MNSPHNSSPLTNHNIDQSSVVISESGLMRHDEEVVTTLPDLAETQTQQPLPLQLSTPVIPAPSRSLDGHNDLPSLVSGNIHAKDTSDDTEPEFERV